MHTHDYKIKANFIAQEGQKTFRLDRPFVNGTINVYVDGLLQSFGDKGDYVTMGDAGSILFQRPLKAGSVVQVISDYTVSSIKVMSFGRRDCADALYRKYSSVEKLKFNNKYTVRTVIGGKEFTWSFKSKLTPLWCSIQRIHEDIGEFIQGFTDEYIENMIHRNSWELLDRIKDAVEEGSEDLNEKAEPLTIANPLTGAYESTYLSANNWVRYKTEIDLIYARYYGISFNYGTKEKEIGDIRISNNVKLPYIDQLLDKLRKGLDDMEEDIFGAHMIAASFQKGRVKYDYETVARNVSWS